MNTQIDDEILMAYADGELDAVQAAQVERAMQTDAGIAARVAQHRALRAKLQSGLKDVLSEPMPQRLLDTLRAPSATAGKVVEFAKAKQTKVPMPRNWHSRDWIAMAASLIAGIVIGLYALNFNSQQPVSEQDGVLIAQGTLDEALTRRLASTADAAEAVKIGISFRNRDGEYCRSFTLTEPRLAGLACREQEQWRVQILTDTGNEAGEFRQAASPTPAAVLTLIEQQIVGEPLDAEAEAAALRDGWQ